MADEDWRLTFERDWMYGAKLQRRVFTAPTPDWDHEHCVLCQDTFMEPPTEGMLHQGYVRGYDRSGQLPPLEQRLHGNAVEAPTQEEWICEACFEDFRERFHWIVVDEDDL